MRSQKLALSIVAFAGKSRINSVAKFAVVLLLSLTFPVLVVAKSKEVAIAQTQTGEETRQEALQINQLGVEQFNKNQFQEALETFQKALAIFREMGDTLNEGYTLNMIAFSFHKLKQYPQALESYKQALEIYNQIHNKAMQFVILNSIGRAYLDWEQYLKALEFFQQALVLRKQLGNHEIDGNTLKIEGNILKDIGQIYDKLEQYYKALEFYQPALTIHKKLGNHKLEASILKNVGQIHDKLGEYSKALEIYQQALIISKSLGDRELEAYILNNIGQIHDKLGKYSKALEFYQQALVISKEIRNNHKKEIEGIILNNIGGVYQSLGENFKALQFYKQALITFKQINYLELDLTTLNNIFTVYNDLKLYSEALEFYQQALVHSKQINNKAMEGALLNSIGVVYLELGEYSKALKFCEQALTVHKEINDKAGEGTALNNIGGVYSNLGQSSKALEFYQQALEIYKQLDSKDAKATILANIGNNHLQTGQITKAIENLSASIDVGESLRTGLGDASKVSIIDEQFGGYMLLQQAYIAQNQYEKALEISERGRARAFVELLAEKQKTQAQARPSINQLKQIAKEQNATLIEYSIILEEFKIEGKKQWLESQLYIWVVKPTGKVEFKSVDLRKQNTTIASLIPSFRKSLNIRSRNVGEPVFKPGNRVNFKDDKADVQPWEVISFDAQKQEISVTHPTFGRGLTITRPITEVDDSKLAPLQELHKLLIKPIAEFLPTKETDKIIFIPQAELFSVPFAALQDKKGKFLIEKHTILTAPSIQVLDLTRKQRQKLPNNSKEALVVGNPNPMPQPFDALKYATSEAQAIAKLYNTQAIIDNAATETAIVAKMPNARIIHLATHGDFNNTKGLESKIVLAPDTKNDGFLTAGEIFDLFGQPNSQISLRAELVVLSACDTGRGEISGDGVIGLSRSLISAGVPSVVVSLWSVDDGATKFLMEEFYQQLKNNDKATALRNAMLATKEKNPSPQYWAAFTLIGEAN